MSHIVDAHAFAQALSAVLPSSEQQADCEHKADHRQESSSSQTAIQNRLEAMFEKQAGIILGNSEQKETKAKRAVDVMKEDALPYVLEATTKMKDFKGPLTDESVLGVCVSKFRTKLKGENGDSDFHEKEVKRLVDALKATMDHAQQFETNLVGIESTASKDGQADTNQIKYRYRVTLLSILVKHRYTTMLLSYRLGVTELAVATLLVSGLLMKLRTRSHAQMAVATVLSELVDRGVAVSPCDDIFFRCIPVLRLLAKENHGKASEAGKFSQDVDSMSERGELEDALEDFASAISGQAESRHINRAMQVGQERAASEDSSSRKDERHLSIATPTAKVSDLDQEYSHLMDVWESLWGVHTEINYHELPVCFAELAASMALLEPVNTPCASSVLAPENCNAGTHHRNFDAKRSVGQSSPQLMEQPLGSETCCAVPQHIHAKGDIVRALLHPFSGKSVSGLSARKFALFHCLGRNK